MFHEALTLARLELGLTQQQAGERIGLPPNAAKRTFSYYERGARTPSPDRIAAIRALLSEAIAHARAAHPAPRGGQDDDDDLDSSLAVDGALTAPL